MTRNAISTRAAILSALLATAALPAVAAKAPATSSKTAPNAAAAARNAAVTAPVNPVGTPGGAGATRSAVAPPFQALPLDSDQQRTLYALGLALSQSLSRLDLQGSELAYLVQGLQDGVLGRDPRVKVEEYASKVQDLAQARLAATSEREQAQAKEFLSRMAAQPGAMRTDSGIVIITQQEGKGTSPKSSDTVRVNYEGALPDGTVFDSSIQRGEPASFPLDQVIPCWTEALQKMKVGGRAKVVCPSSLAYGEEGRPGIPPNSPLVFDIHLLGVGDVSTASPGNREQHPPLLQQVAMRIGR